MNNQSAKQQYNEAYRVSRLLVSMYPDNYQARVNFYQQFKWGFSFNTFLMALGSCMNGERTNK